MDLFGRKKRRAKRIKKYEEDYRKMSLEARRRHAQFIYQTAIHGIFRNEAVIEQCEAAVAVERSECAESP